METKFVRHNGARLAYKAHGEGQAVVLLHGFCGSSAYWEQVLPLLPDNYRFIAPDLRGHGESASPEGEYTMEAFAGDLAELLQQLRIERAIVLGHSLGGYATLAFAERHPELLAAFGLIHSTAFPDSDEAKEGRLKGMDTIREKGISAFVEGLAPKLFAPVHLQTMAQAVRETVAIGRGTHPEGAIRTLDGMRRRPDRNHVLAEAKMPVLIVAGDHDQVIPAERAFSVTGGQIAQRQIAGAGHMSMMEAPHKLAQVIVEFITTV
ncbi:alpha/beta fold hydrolase [Paenibacillus xerothermodurans]|uniref:Alpha/beta hydrolase n=1 Tax=Paenibacillus xerothermodurans TaxID=1977292 RepID=A0A2W1N932_PAEXE|nr:alpha/beta hydrolase [Paenibacillus xerothermodurans]PZE20434.1 alpha/beta hydrolase [Paenibacillus xerothermodurans]